MRDFNWDDFKNGKIAVNCRSKNTCIDFLNKCKEVGVSNEYLENGVEEYAESSFAYSGKKTCYGVDEEVGFGHDDIEYHKKYDFKIVEWEIDKIGELTFKEVINQIKPNETWVGEYHKIEFAHNRLKISNIDDKVETYYSFKEDDKFKLEVKKYSFEEALKFMREGKIMKSFLGYKHKVIDNQICSETNIKIFKCTPLYSEEILGEWELEN